MVAGGLPPAAAMDISGAGATFPYPIYAKWADAYKKETGTGLNYQSIGSGGGIKQIQNKTVTFGASDMPLSPDALNKDGLIQFPTVIGGAVPVVNLEGIKPGELKLDGPTLAKIYLGDIKTWNDPALAKLNPNAKLPAQAIVVVHRSDGSGTTFIWSDYLSKVSADWKSKVGGKTVEPSSAAFQAAAASAKWDKADGFHVILTDQAGAGSWPIAGATFILIHKQPKDPAAAAEALKFFTWAYAKGDKMAEQLDFVPLPKNVVSEIEKVWATEIKDANGKPIYAMAQ